MWYTVIFILCQLYPHSLYQTEIFNRLSQTKVETVEVFALLDYLGGFLAIMQKMFLTAFSLQYEMMHLLLPPKWTSSFSIFLLDVVVSLLMTFRSLVTLCIFLTYSPGILLSLLPGTSHSHDETVQQYLRDCYIYNTSVVLQKLQKLQKNWNILSQEKRILDNL